MHFFVDGEDQVFASLRPPLHTAKPFTASIHRNEHLPGLAAQPRIEAALDSAQAFIIQTHVTKHLCRELALGIKTLRLLLKINSLQVEGADTVGGAGINLAGDPAKGM